MYSKMPTKPKICIFFRFGLPTTVADMVSYTPQFKHKNNQKALTDCVERCWMLYVQMWGHQQRRVVVQ